MEAGLACSSCGEVNPARARFCLNCGESLAEITAGREARKTVTVIFADLTGSTGIGERLDPESTRKLMRRFFTEMQSVIELHGGRVEKFIGDAVMAVFGVPLVHEDDALRAVRAADRMRAALAPLNEEARATWGLDLRIRIGVNTGEVVVGDPNASSSIVVGDAVNTAARLEQTAEPGEILIGEATYRLVRDSVVAERIDALALKGKEDPVVAFRLASVGTADKPSPARWLITGMTSSDAADPALAFESYSLASARPRSPLVGRDGERALLTQILERTITERTCHLFTVLGGAGVGKSRLVGETLAGAGTRASVLTGRCLPYGEGITFWPAGEIVRAAAGISASDSPANARDRLTGLLDGHPEREAIVARIATMLGLAEGKTSTEETFWAVQKLLEHLAGQEPLVVVFDDVHWAEPTMLHLIDHIADWTREVPLLILCLARPDLLETRPAWGGGRVNASTILLDPLTEAEARVLILNLVGGTTVDRDAATRLTEASGGNPLFVEEMLSMLIDDGLLTRGPAGWHPTAPLVEVAIPPTINALLAARLDRLSDEERQVIEGASVIGKHFTNDELIQISREELRGRVDDVLLALVRKELVRRDTSRGPQEQGYAFRHILMRDAAYGAMAKELRADLHERLARWLSEKAPERLAEHEEFVGYHLEQAVAYRRELGIGDESTDRLAGDAAGHLAAAGRRAIARGDARAAANLLERATSLLPENDRALIDLLVDLGEAYLSVLDLARAQGALDDAVAAAQALGDRAAEARAVTARMFLELTVSPAGRVEQIGVEAQALLSEVEALGDDAALARLWFLISQVEMVRARGRECQNALERTIAHALRVEDVATQHEACAWLVTAVLYGPTPADEGIKICGEVAELARTDPRLTSMAQVALGALRAMQGDLVGGRSLCAAARERLRELGHRFTFARTAQLAALIEMLAGDPAAAEQELERGYRILEQEGEQGFLSTHAAMLAHALCEQGRFDDAERYSLLGEQIADDDDITTQVEARAARAKVMAHRGEHGPAAVLAREAVELAERSDFLQMIGHTLCDEATVLRLAGNAPEARPLLERARSLYEQKGDAVSAARVRALLEEG